MQEIKVPSYINPPVPCIGQHRKISRLHNIEFDVIGKLCQLRSNISYIVSYIGYEISHLNIAFIISNIIYQISVISYKISNMLSDMLFKISHIMIIQDI